MVLTLPMVLALLVAPIVVLLAGKRLAPRASIAFVVTAVLTWLVTTVALSKLLTDSDDITHAILCMLVITPLAGTAVAAIVASRVMKGPLLPTLVFACQGWYVGLIVFMFVVGDPDHRASGELWEWMLATFNAIPAAYAACGAVTGASLRWRNP